MLSGTEHDTLNSTELEKMSVEEKLLEKERKKKEKLLEKERKKKEKLLEKERKKEEKLVLKESAKAEKLVLKESEKAEKLVLKESEKAEKLLEKKRKKEEERICVKATKDALRVSLPIQIKKEDISHFIEASDRGGNHDANDKREAIIVMMLNERVPQEFIEYDPRWGLYSTRVRDCVDERIKSEGVALINHVEFTRAGGRGKHHDIELIGDGKVLLKIEFKNGANEVLDTPQFVSPMNPSQYMTISFEIFWYHNFLPKIVEGTGLTVPEKDIYMKQIHSNQPTDECMRAIQIMYYKGCPRSSQYSGLPEHEALYKKCNDLSKYAITKFLERDDVALLHDALSAYFVNTQEKVYLLYKDGEFRSQRINPNEFVIDTYVKDPAKFRFIVRTKTGKKLYILLRWKNGNGVAFPAFQISLK